MLFRSGFSQNVGGGGAWDEIYYTDHASPADAAAAWGSNEGFTAIASGKPLYTRLQMLSSDCSLYYARFAALDVAPRPRAILQRGNATGFRSAENVASDAASFRLSSVAGAFSRQVRLGGLPDNVVVSGVIQLSFISSYMLSGSGFVGQWAGIGGCIRGRSSTVGGELSQPIVSVVKQNQTSLCSIVMAAPISNLAVNSTVVIGMRGQPQFRGNWVVASLSTDGTTIVLRGSEKVSAPTNPAGFVTKYVPSFELLATSITGAPLSPAIVGLTPHKLGKKKYQPRARRSPILIRH